MRLEGSAPIRSLGTTTRRFRRRRRIGFNAPCAERGVAGSLVRKRLEDTKFLITRRYLPESDITMARLTVGRLAQCHFSDRGRRRASLLFCHLLACEKASLAFLLGSSFSTDSRWVR